MRTIIDLRLAHELDRDPSPFAAHQGPGDVPRYISLPLHDLETDAAMNAAASTQEEYIILLERNKERGVMHALTKYASNE